MYTQNVKKKKQAKKKHNFALVFTLFIVAVALFTLYTTLPFPSLQKVTKQETITPSIPVSLTITPTPAPPTATPTVTPEPLIGYCLRVPVIMYHHVQPMDEAKQKNQGGLSVDPGMFDHQMAYLTSAGYTTLFANELVHALKNKAALPAKSILVTFDDGYRDNHMYAFPIIKKYGIKANLMLTTGLMEGADYLTWDQVSDIKNSGLFYFTDHTWSHANVAAGTEEKIRYEIETAKKQIQDKTGQVVDIFTYPYGASGPLAIKILQETGFTGAFTTIPGVYQCDSFIFRLRRLRIGNSPLSTYGL